MKAYSQVFKDQVIKAVLIDKMPIKRACKVFLLSRGTVRSWIRREQGLVPKTKSPTPNEIKEKAVNDIIYNGVSKTQTAKELGISLSTVYYWLREYEYTFPYKQEYLHNQNISFDNLKIWKAKDQYFKTANDAINYLIESTSSESLTSDTDEKRTIKLMQPVLAKESIGTEAYGGVH